MSYSVSYADLFSRVYLAGAPDKDRDQARMIEGALSKLPGVEVFRVAGQSDITEGHMNQRTLVITEDKGNMLKPCPASRGRICCNYLTLNVYGGCTLGCTYCVMKTYLNYKPITVAVNVKEGLDGLKRLSMENPGKTFRAGTGETGDSLLLDPLFGISRIFIEGLKDYPSVFFEVKTKTTFVDHLLDVPDKGSAVVGFSLNPQSIAAAEEPGAAAVPERLAAAERAVVAGYRVSFHFDPVILGGASGTKPADGAWEESYGSLAGSLARFPKGSIAWISIGLFRYPPSLKEIMDPRPYLYGEFLLSGDGKYRYMQKKRIEVYRRMLHALRQATDAPVYLCMENEAVWRAVFGGLPQSKTELKPIFSRVRGTHRG